MPKRITWTRASEYHVTCGTHNISKAFVNGTPLYQLWELKKSQYLSDSMLGVFDSFDAAVKHYDKIHAK